MTKCLITKIKSIITLLIVFVVQIGNAQIQKGSDIDGEFDHDWSGCAVSMPDENTVAIGAVDNDGNGTSSGHVRIYVYDGSAWIQKGLDIDGEAAGDEAGISVSMPHPNTVAIGAIRNDNSGTDAGHVRVFIWDGTSWIQKGADILGDNINDLAGFSVSMPDTNTVAFGAPFNDGNGMGRGQVSIFSWNGISWVQKGLDISGEGDYEASGWSICMPDSNTIAIGAPYNGGNGPSSGSVRIFTWNGNLWTQKGSDLNGEAANDLSGYSVAMPDSNTIAIGAYLNDDNGLDAGHVRIYNWNGFSWLQKGADIDGENANDFTGCSISMPDPVTVAISAHLNDGNGTNAGHVRIYSWNGISWIQKGVDIDGEATNDWFGSAVCMVDSNTVAIGAPMNDGNGINAGHVRVFSLNNNVAIPHIDSENPIKIYPNPTNDDIFLDIESLYADITVNIRNALGQVVSIYKFSNKSKLHISLPANHGIYFIELILDNNKIYLQAIKE